MKQQLLVEITTESYDEQQFILSRFPEAYWYVTENTEKTKFYLPEDRENEISEAIHEWNEVNERKS